MSSIVSVFPSTDLRRGHKGLRDLALRSKRNPDLLDPGQFLFFLNKKQDAFKLIGANNVMVHWKAKTGRVDVRAIKFLPQCFKAGDFDFNIAVRHSLKETLGKRFSE